MGGRRQSLILQPDRGVCVVGGEGNYILWLLISELPHHPFQLEAFPPHYTVQRCKNSESVLLVGPCLLTPAPLVMSASQA